MNFSSMDNLNLKQIISEGFEQWKEMAYNENYFLLLTQHCIVIQNSYILKCRFIFTIDFSSLSIQFFFFFN